MREQVYLATKEAHEKVESQFGFAQGLKESAYYRFLLTMYRARKNYQPSFDALERLSGMSTFNSSLLRDFTKPIVSPKMVRVIVICPYYNPYRDPH